MSELAEPTESPDPKPTEPRPRGSNSHAPGCRCPFCGPGPGSDSHPDDCRCPFCDPTAKAGGRVSLSGAGPSPMLGVKLGRDMHDWVKGQGGSKFARAVLEAARVIREGGDEGEAIGKIRSA